MGHFLMRARLGGWVGSKWCPHFIVDFLLLVRLMAHGRTCYYYVIESRFYGREELMQVPCQASLARFLLVRALA